MTDKIPYKKPDGTGNVVAPVPSDMPDYNPGIGDQSKVVFDIDLGGWAIEVPLSTIYVNLAGYTVLQPPPVYQCIHCFTVLPHGYNATKGIMRIALCKQHGVVKQHDQPTGKIEG